MSARNFFNLFAAIAVWLMLGASPALAQSSKVVKLKGLTPAVFQLTEGRYRKSGTLDSSTLTFPADVLKISPKGYVQVQSINGAIWLDKLDVVLDPPLTVKASCLTGVSVASDATSAVTRGAGEGCRP